MFCKRCGKQIADGSTSCQYCGAVVTKRPATNTYTNFNAPAANTSYQAPQPEKKQNKTPWKIIAPVVAVLLVAAIVFGVVSCSKGKQKEHEDKLRQLLEESTSKPVVEFMCDDFDNNGDFEAYAVVGKSEKKDDIIEYYDADICFVNEDSAELIKESVRGHSNGTIESDGKIYVSLEVYDEQTGKGVSLIYSASENRPVESEISGQYSNVRQENGKILATDETGDDMEIDIPNAFRKLDTIELTTFVTTLPEGVTDFTETTDAESTTQSETTTKEKLTVTTTQPTTSAQKVSSDVSSIYEPEVIKEAATGNFYGGVSETVKSCFIDINNDGVDELVVRYRQQSYEKSAVYAIQNNKVVNLGMVEHAGGSSGGEFYTVKYNSNAGNHVVAVSGNTNIGARAATSYLTTYYYDGVSFTAKHSVEGGYYSYDGFASEAEEIKRSTSLYVEKDGRVWYYLYDGNYISEAEYESIRNNYVDPVNAKYQMKVGTPSNPLP